MTDRTSPALVGVLLALCACFLFGASGTVIRLGIQGGGDTSTMIVMQAVLAAILSWGVAGERPRLERAAVGGLVLLTLVAGTGAICLLEGYARLGVAPTAIIFALYPGVVGLYQWMFEGRRPGGMWFVAFGLAIAGVVLALSGEESRSARPLWEFLFPVVATLTVAANDLLVPRVVKATPTSQAIGWLNAFTAVLAVLVYNQRVAASLTDPASLLAGGALGVMVYVALQTKFRGIVRVGPGLVSLVGASQPALAVAVAAVVLRERLSVAQLLGIGLVVVALFLIARNAEGFAVSRRA